MMEYQEIAIKRQMVLNLASKYGYDEKHALLVETASLMIFDVLEKLHKLGCKERILLSHACILHDIGIHINSKRHNRNSRYLIENDICLNDYDEKDKRTVALIAYNHTRKSIKKALTSRKKDNDIVLQLSSILCVADSLEYINEEIVIKRIEIRKNDMLLFVDDPVLETVVKRLAEKKILFKGTFKLDVKIKQETTKKNAETPNKDEAETRQ